MSNYKHNSQHFLEWYFHHKDICDGSDQFNFYHSDHLTQDRAPSQGHLQKMQGDLIYCPRWKYATFKRNLEKKKPPKGRVKDGFWCTKYIRPPPLQTNIFLWTFFATSNIKVFKHNCLFSVYFQYPINFIWRHPLNYLVSEEDSSLEIAFQRELTT